ncbi:MAG: AraC family transcriptional regulator [Roseateles sp.]|uniref:AraC family transcriptional regulator n=1 Tax=Roseateles sp. TaxID=1971397 RepID=UPI0039ED6562
MHRPPPDMEPRVYGAQKIAALVATLAEDGIAPAAVLAGSGITEDALADARLLVSFAQGAAVFRNAARLAVDPATAFRAGSRMHLTALGIYGYGLLSSPTHADQVDFIVKYNRMTGPMAGPSLFTCDGEHGVYAYEVLVTPDPHDPLYRFALEFACAAQLTVSRDLHGGDFNFVEIRAACPAPADAARYPALFGCPVHFGQRHDEVVIDMDWARFANRIPDTATHGAVREICQQFVVDLSHAGGTAAIVRRTLVEQMPWRFPTIETMAAALSLHPRTLRRRLESDGTTFKDLLTEVRRRLAIDYLRQTRMTTEEIATRLGYSDAANFRHAFVRWTGRTPHEYRGGRADASRGPAAAAPAGRPPARV